MKVDKDQFDALLNRLLKQKPEKTQAIKGSPTPKRREPIISKPQGAAPSPASSFSSTRGVICSGRVEWGCVVMGAPARESDLKQLAV
jgi:hypothetical protein